MITLMFLCALFALLFLAGYFVMYTVAKYKILEKMGDEGWKAIIPFYGKAVIYGKVWTPWAYVVVVLLDILLSLLEGTNLFFLHTFVLLMYYLIKALFYTRLTMAFEKYNTWLVVGLLIPFVDVVFLNVIAFDKRFVYNPDFMEDLKEKQNMADEIVEEVVEEATEPVEAEDAVTETVEEEIAEEVAEHLTEEAAEPVVEEEVATETVEEAVVEPETTEEEQKPVEEDGIPEPQDSLAEAEDVVTESTEAEDIAVTASPDAEV